MAQCTLYGVHIDVDSTALQFQHDQPFLMRLSLMIPVLELQTIADVLAPHGSHSWDIDE